MLNTDVSDIKKNILFVDDDINFLELMEYDLMDTPDVSEKFSIYIEQDVDKAFALFSSREYAVVFIDLYMPGTSGLLLCRKIRKLPIIQPRIVILTGEIESETKEMVLNAGADYFLSKPFRKEDIISILDNL